MFNCLYCWLKSHPIYSSIKANLPLIEEKEDQTNMHQVRNLNVGKQPIWIGGAFLNGSFRWDNKKKTRVLHGFQNWLPGQPNNFGYVGNQKNCMTMSLKGKWTSEKCNSKYAVVCERCLTCEENYSSG